MGIKEEKKVSRILRDIRNIKIQGARNIARAALEAYELSPTEKTKKKLIATRPTEPMMINVLHILGKVDGKAILDHFEEAQEQINQFVFKMIKDGDVIFTHCHSTNVVNALINAKKKGKKFEVHNTETRPLFQGRKTAVELEKAGIKTTTFIDSGVDVALVGNGKKVTKVMLGCDALLKEGIINKIGSNVIAQLAELHNIPLYIVGDSWKYFPKHIKIEERNFREVWKKVPIHVRIRNPAFEFVEKKYIEKIISELGSLDYEVFLKKVG